MSDTLGPWLIVYTPLFKALELVDGKLLHAPIVDAGTPRERLRYTTWPTAEEALEVLRADRYPDDLVVQPVAVFEEQLERRLRPPPPAPPPPPSRKRKKEVES